MSKIFTHKEISYELKETQGFYFCLVYAQGKKSRPYQTKYFASAEGARSEAIAFIEYYDTFGKNKQKESRAQRQKQNQEKGKTKRSKLKEVRRITPTPKPKKEINRAQRLKSQDSQQGRRVGILPVLLLVGVSLLIMTLIAYGYSEYVESEGRQNQVIPTTPGIDSPGIGIPLPPPRETIDLPQVSQPQTPTLAVTPTTTTTITPTSTNFSTQPPISATNTQRPTDPPSLTITPTPSTSPSPTNTATPTSPPGPTHTLTPTPTMSPTLTPPPSTSTPTATITPSATPTTP